MSMVARPITCGKCRATLLGIEVYTSTEFIPCPSCDGFLRAEIFPAFFRPDEKGRAGENALVEGESTCFFHPQKKAVVPCDLCGRFLCALCDLNLDGRRLCPSCLERGRENGSWSNLETKRVRHDQVALALAIFPILLWFLTPVTAPATIYYVVRNWKSPASLVRSSRPGLAAALGIAWLELLGWVIIGIMMMKG